MQEARRVPVSNSIRKSYIPIVGHGHNHRDNNVGRFVAKVAGSLIVSSAARRQWAFGVFVKSCIGLVCRVK